MAGMVLVFAGVSSMVGYVLFKLFGVDITQIDAFVENPTEYEREMLFVKLFQIIAGVGTFIIPAMLFPKAINKLPLPFLRIKEKTSGYAILVAIFLIVIAIPAISFIYNINKSFVFPESLSWLEVQLRQMEENAQNITNAMVNSNSFAQLLLNALVVAVVPAIAEELFFRGCLQNFVRLVFQNIHLSVWFTAIIFSGFHGQFFGFIPRMLLGVILGYIFVFSGSIWVAVIAHFINNFLALLSAYLFKLNPHWQFLSDDFVFPLWTALISLALIVATIYFMLQQRFRNLQMHE
jgi:membrane protease YdiL (CAAX protease family)